MSPHEEDGVRAIEALDTPAHTEQLAAPLDFFISEHFRQRALCTVLNTMAEEKSPGREKLSAALRFLRDDFRVHLIDEEDDLFPMLRRRSDPHDHIDDVLGRLCREHAADDLDAERIAQGLSDALEAGRSPKLSEDLRTLLHAFAALKWSHLALENAIILPLARVRLTPDDIRNLGRRMAARRGIDYPDPAHAH